MTTPAGGRRRRGARFRDERGVAAAIVLMPIFFAVVFMFVQGTLWQLDRQVVRAAADRVSQSVALYGSSEGDARSEATAQLQAAGIDDISISVSRGAEFTTVAVSGTSPGLLAGMTVTVSATSVTPTEGLNRP